MTKIDIFSGFLGAGKTTLIKKLIDEAYKGEKLVLIENEFGEIGIDGGFLKDAGIEITEMNSGCICCSLVGDFAISMRQVLAKFSPDRILIEPSGVGKLSDVMASVLDLEKEADVKLGALVTVVNSLKADKQMKAFGEFFNNQIEHATTVILSRTQNVDQGKLESCVKQIQGINGKCAIISTHWDDISGEKMLNVMEGQDNLEARALAEQHHHEHEHHHHEHHHDHEHEHHHEHHHHEHEHHHDHEHHHEHDHHHHHHDHDADEIFDTWGKETPHIFSRATIETALKSFCDGDTYGTVIRAKGMVPSDSDEWIYFDLVDGEYEIRSGAPDYTGRLVVIGVDLDEHGIEELFGL